MTFFRVCVCACVISITTTAGAEICPVDLEELTADLDSQYHLYFGQLERRTTSPPLIVLCLGTSTAREDESVWFDTELVAFIESGPRGSCGTSDYSASCGQDGCSSLEVIVWQKDTITLGVPEPGLRCHDTRGLLSPEGGVFALEHVPDGHRVAVFDTLDDGVMGFDGTRAQCSLNADDTWTIYGRGYWRWPPFYFYSGGMYVCSGQSWGPLRRICSYSPATMQNPGLIMIEGNAQDNVIMVDYCYGDPGITCNDGLYRVHWWDHNWIRGMYLWGGDGADLLVGSPNNDYIYGLNGNDYLYGAGGDDVIRGYAGIDTLVGDSQGLCSGGGTGDDGNDTLYGGPGNDTLLGGGGTDALYGDEDHDYLDGQGGTGDVCNAGSGTEGCPNEDCCAVPGCEHVSGCEIE